jgi:hypothetical protein
MILDHVKAWITDSDTPEHSLRHKLYAAALLDVLLLQFEQIAAFYQAADGEGAAMLADEMAAELPAEMLAELQATEEDT